MATRKTKQDISKEDMFNKIMPSLNQKNNDDDIEEEAPKKSTRTKSTADKKNRAVQNVSFKITGIKRN